MRKLSLLVAAVALTFATGCKSKEQKAAEETAKNLEEANKQLKEATKNGTVDMGAAAAAMGAAVSGAANGGRKVETVDYSKLKALLPESLSGMKRTDATGEKTAAMGMQISNAEGSYSSEQGGSMTIKITDIGSMTGLAGVTAYAWSAASVDRESDTGYEKTSTIKGFKSHEKYDNSGKYGEVSVMIADRFVVEVNGNGVDMAAIKDAIGKVDLGKLNGMKDEGVH